MIELDVLSSQQVAADGQPRLWRSHAELEGSEEHRRLASDEFLPGATDTAELAASAEPSRRSFMKLMGASMALAGAGLAGCRRPVEQIMPYARRPEEILPGVPNFYATAMPIGGVVHALLVESHEGRPTKVEGNPEHPVSHGATNVFAQASILDLYDPDRSRRIQMRGGTAATRADVANLARQTLAGAGQQRMVILSEPTSSPTARRLRQQLLERYPNATWITYDPKGQNREIGLQLAFGSRVRPLFRLSAARTVVSFDDDFLGPADANMVWNSREFAASRRLRSSQDTMSRLYVVESAMTPTGGQADHRMRLRASDIPFFAAAVGQRLGVGTAPAAGARFMGHPFVEAIAEDVMAAGGNAAFFAGEAQPAQVHALAAALNAQFGGGVAQYVQTDEEPITQTQEHQMAQLTSAMGASQIHTLLMIGVNPVYDFPPELGFIRALERVPNSIHLGMHVDETAQRSRWHLPRAHFLEAWGDGRAYDGTISIIQPLIQPLYGDAISEIELLSLFTTGVETAGYDIVRQSWEEQGIGAGAFNDAWRTALHDGFVPDTQFTPAGAGGGAASMAALPVLPQDQVEVVIRTDNRIYDGRFANNAWLQELPDPVTKITWDNAAIMSQATAEALGVARGFNLDRGKQYANFVSITVPGGHSVNLPVWIQPGHPDNSITVTTGYGRAIKSERVLRERGILARVMEFNTDHWNEGPISTGVGTSVSVLRSATGGSVLQSVSVRGEGGSHMLATTQDHGSMINRPIVRMATVDQYASRPQFARDMVPAIENTPWQEFPPLWGFESSPQNSTEFRTARYAEHQWGMTIDLNTCTGCNACVVACQSENNIQIVGKDQVARGREMHWLRLDRYYVGENDDTVGMVFQPMMCVHCDYAPCESVCPVAATTTSPDGINEMTYNRCIGTRYCSNNCPYKVRRFNFYNWSKHIPLETQMAMNPDVTVRFRGVMEKCTYCVQRVREAGRHARQENRPIRDGEVVTACQQACPAQAIVFGDIADPNSQVSQWRRLDRGYELLEELNTKPRTTYLARVTNPNPRLVDNLVPGIEQPVPDRQIVPPGQPATPGTPEPAL